ncbi:ATP-binding protein [Candidatus Poribacteria bacterium]
MNSMSYSRHSSLVKWSILPSIVLGMYLMVAVSSHGQSPASQDSPVIDIPQNDWYYRWGDSPVDDQGMPLWIDAPDSEWTLVGEDSDFKANPQKNRTLWFMIRLPDGRWKHPTLLVPSVMHDLEVYQDHQRIYQFGDFESSRNDRFSTIYTHLVPLEGNIQNTTVFLRIHSSSSQHIGLVRVGPNKAWLGPQTELAKALVRHGLEGFVLGFLYVCASLFAIFVYFRRRTQEQYIALSFAGFLFFSGMGSLGGASVGQFFVKFPAIRYYAAFGSFYLASIGQFIFCEQVLGSGYKRVIRRMWQLHIPIAVIGFLLDATNVLPIPYLLNYLFVLLIVELCIIIIISVNAAHKGSFEAKIFNVGMAVMMLSAVHDMLVAIGVIPMWYMLFVWGELGFMISLGYILEHRFAEAHRQLEEYSLTLEQKVEERTQELREAQSQMVMQSKMASLGDLVAGVAHEMNNPIGVIHSTADTANRGIRKLRNIFQKVLERVRLLNLSDQNLGEFSHDEEQLQQSLSLLERNHEVISTASDRVANIVGSLRSFASLDEALFQQVDIHKNIDTTLTLIHHELVDKVEVTKEYGEIPQIQCYPNELNQAFMNLLRNAAQAIEESGNITIATYADEAQLYIKISDTGRGISSENLPKIYDPGFTTQSEGVGKGLGLSIVYNIIQKHRGSIEVNSEIGAGTQVLVALPIEQTSV